MQPGTVEAWCADYVRGTDLAAKLRPSPRPALWAEAPEPLRIARPGRPAELVISDRRHKPMGPNALERVERRIEVVHTFLHHELQAAELMAWAVLAFPDTPRAFRQGVLGVLDDELRHMQHYDDYLHAHESFFGAIPVRDWFWQRIPSCETPRAFVATMGMGFEGGNLDHAKRFAERFRAAGDEEGARVQELIGEEEIAHVRFARTWFLRLGGTDDFDAWRAELPKPLSPILMRGKPLDRVARKRAGYTDAFLEALEAYEPS